MLPLEQIPRYSYKDYQQWQGDWELIHGYAYAMSPSPFSKHQLAATKFSCELEAALRKNKYKCNCHVFSELDWIIDEQTVVRPDVMIACGNIDLNDHLRIPPVLIVEIFSDSSRLKDRNTKFKLYEQCGVKYYLMADPDKKSVEFFQLVNNQYQEQAAISSFLLSQGCEVEVALGDVFGV